EDRRDMARGALARSPEDLLSASRRGRIEAAGRRLGGLERELIEVEGGLLRRGAVRVVADIVKVVGRGDRELLRVPEAVVDEHALSLHLDVGDEAVPVGDRPPARVGVEV